MADRYFTVEEANALLSEVRPLAERMVEHRRALSAALERQEELTRKVSGNGGGLPTDGPAEIQEAIEREATGIAECLNEIQELGAQVKDLDTGLLDFPALRDGEEILLCWHLGEDEIQFFHGLEDGFAGRQPL